MNADYLDYKYKEPPAKIWESSFLRISAS